VESKGGETWCSRSSVRLQQARGAKFDVELTAADLKGLVARYKSVYVKHGIALPEDPLQQMRTAINAVFGCAQVI
jgi:pyruvate, orthophosphate dikinase